jgi:hypothetical protein
VSPGVEKRDSAPATLAESIYTTPTHELPKEQFEEKSENPFDVNFDESLEDKYFKMLSRVLLSTTRHDVRGRSGSGQIF